MASPVLYFIRHGETAWNAERRLQGQRDIPLNALGHEQAARCGSILNAAMARGKHLPEDFDFIASPLSRARVTMELVRDGLGLDRNEYRTEPRLMELSFGEWEGWDYDELRRHQPDHPVLARTSAPGEGWRLAPPGGESYEQLLARVCAWHAEVERDTVVVAHGGVCRVLFVHFGIEEAQSAHQIEQGVVYQFAPGRLTRLG